MRRIVWSITIIALTIISFVVIKSDFIGIKRPLDESRQIEKNKNYETNETKTDDKKHKETVLTPKENIEHKDIANKEAILCLGGDVMMDSYVAGYIKDNGVDYPWSSVSNFLKEADISLVNLETSVSTRGSTKKPAGYGFRSNPKTLEGLKNAGIDLVSIANNHVLDFGKEAFYDTLKYLDEYKIGYVGGGENRTKAEEVAIIEKNGIKFGFISYTSITPNNAWIASDNSQGIAVFKGDKDGYAHLVKNVKAAKNKCDILIVILHWGVEYDKAPKKWQTDMAHALVDSGADVIYGHHPHVLQGIEIYKGKPILYSTGNFVFLKNDDECGKTGIFQMTFDKDGFKKGKFIPVSINYCKANILKNDDDKGKDIINMLINLSGKFGTKIGLDGEF